MGYEQVLGWTANFNFQSWISGAADHLAASAVILILAFVVKKVVNRAVGMAVSRVEDADPTATSALEQRAQTLGDIVKNSLGVIIWGMAGMMVLSEWGINITPILTGAGIVGLAVGFGAQSLVKDIVTGFFILFENQVNKGDEVEIAGLSGRVSRMNLRTTILKDKKGNVHIIPNSQITKITKKRKGKTKKKG